MRVSFFLLIFCLLLAGRPSALAVTDCAKKFSALEPFPNPQPLPLASMEELFAAAGLSDQAGLFTANAAAVETIYDYARVHHSLGAGYMLAPDRFRGVSEFYPSRAGLAHWSQGYRDHHLLTKGPNHTANYLEAITATEKPIVFFVPPNVMTREGITRDEILWFLAHPEKMKNVRFVFGAYDVFSEELIQRLQFTREIKKLFEILGPPEGRPAVL